jgi:Domain of unknown function (DUF6851)/VCPO second helical-bundle domain/Vanadium chloroperoxidase N-terminal domain
VWRVQKKGERMKHKLGTILLVVTALVVATLSAVTVTTRPAKAAPGPGTFWPIDGHGPDEANDNAILRWNERLLESIRLKPRVTGPTVSARAIGILHTATYDAWAAYDDTAVDTRLRLRDNPDLRRPPEEATETNKTTAISYAAYRVLLNLFPGPERTGSFRSYMLSKGYNPDNDSRDPATPEGIGNNAAYAVLDYREDDGSNQQLGSDPVTGELSAVYPDNTGYQPVNSWQTVTYPWRWQPLCVPLVPYGTPCNSPSTVQKALHPQWRYIRSFALNSTTHYPPQFVLPGPKLKNGVCCDPKDVDLALRDTSNLDVIKKAKAEYWSDGPNTEFPPGHMAVFAQALSRMRDNSLDQDVQLFFALGSALLDASISAWESKYQYDFVRPITAIRERYKGKLITSWLGPNQGYGKVRGQEWRPFQQAGVVTPAFPEYVSGHSTFSGAASLVLSMFFGNSAALNATATFKAGSSKIEAGTPATDVVLSWETLIDTSDDAGWSRRWGGIHFETGDLHGRGLGRTIGYNAFNKAQTYFNGTAPEPT